jgi:anaerobic selenocysteine-containing dehydrogenase
MPEEILSDHPERLRAVLVSASNPLRSYADTGAYERAFRALDLLVTVEVAMTETAALSHYVLPARSDYESWDGTFFAWTFPGTYFQMRRPVVKPVGEPRERGQIFTDLAHRLGLLPEIPRDLLDAAKGDRLAFGARLLGFVQSHPGAGEMMPFVLARTLGEVLGSAHLAALWGLLMTAPRQLGKQAARAGFRTGPAMGEEIFRAIVDHPEGLWIGRCDPHKNLEAVRTEDGRIDVYIPELEQWLRGIDATSEAKRLRADGRFPLILNAGRHMDMNANTIMRDPAWNAGRRACTLLMNPGDARSLNLADGQRVRVVTEADEVEIELEVGEETRPGMVLIPHGFGLEHAGETHGVNVNRLTSARHRDPMAGTPLHRYVLCRVEPA